MKLVIMKKSSVWPDLKFAIELPDEMEKTYGLELLHMYLILYLEMALEDIAVPEPFRMMALGERMVCLRKKGWYKRLVKMQKDGSFQKWIESASDMRQR